MKAKSGPGRGEVVMDENTWLACRDPGTLLRWLDCGFDWWDWPRKRVLLFRQFLLSGGQLRHADRRPVQLTDELTGQLLTQMRVREAYVDYGFTLTLATIDSSAAYRLEIEVRRALALLDEIIGNPFRTRAYQTAMSPLRGWNDSTVLRMTRQIQEDESYDHCPILADALDEAGCQDRVILDHLRGPVRHAFTPLMPGTIGAGPTTQPLRPGLQPGSPK